MSIVVPASLLTSEQSKYIKQTLTVTPQLKHINRNKSRGRSIPLPDPVLAYKLKGKSTDSDAQVCLPFDFAKSFTGFNNDYLPHCRTRTQFTGTIREDQKPYVEETINQLNQHRTSVLNMRPGFGKTTMSVAISARSQYLTTVLVHDSNQIVQWNKAYSLRSNAQVWCVGDVMPQHFDVMVCLYTRTEKIDPQIRAQVGFLIIDEIHQFNNRTGVEAILNFTPKYILAATATFEKTNGLHKIAQYIVGERKVMSDQVINFQVIKVNTGLTGKRVNTKLGITDWPVLIQSFLYNPQRNEMIIRGIHMLHKHGRKMLVFSNEVEHVKLLHQLIMQSGLASTDYITGDKSKYSDSAILVGNTQKCGTGFDEEMFCENFSGERINTIVLCGSFKDQHLLYQVVGRAFRSQDPLIMQFVDSDSIIQSHWNSCRLWYTSNGGSISEIQQAQIPDIPGPQLVII